MVKADLSRDYYGDLDLPQNADANDIKKQFKKLALLYHPDRNPGRENEVTARFQRIQSAHEVLTDTHERAKYDSNRIRPNNIYRTGGNQRGNPWSDVGSQYPTPPKAPTARARPPQPPPPSAGAQRYKNFETPRQSANHTAQEGAEARRSTYEAWERMKERAPPSGQAWNKPAPPPRRPHKASHDESNAFKQNANARPRSQNSPRKGFTPNTPGGDEPAAPKGAYSTYREKPAQPHPDFSDSHPFMDDRPTSDSPKYSKSKSNVQFEPRMSTPYATHGGEKFNPFESINMNRSKSTRIPSNKYSSDGIPRVGSDSNLNSSHRPRPQNPGFTKSSTTYTTPHSDGSSSDSSPQIKKKAAPKATAGGTRTFAKARSFTGTRTKPQFATPSMDGQTNGPSQSENTSATTREHPTSSQQTSPQNSADPSMYGTPQYIYSSYSKKSTCGDKLPTVSEQVPSSPKDFSPSPRSQYLLSKGELRSMWPQFLPRLDDKKSASPSGIPRQYLYPLEEAQRSMLDGLIKKRHTRDSNASDIVSSGKSDSNESHAQQSRTRTTSSAFSRYRESPIIPSSQKKQKQHNRSHRKCYNAEDEIRYRDSMNEANANQCHTSRFSFPVDENTFNQTNPSAFNPAGPDSVNTTFSPSDWHAKFESNHFAPDQPTTAAPRNPRPQSGGRTRGRSPTKSRPGEKKPMQAHVDPESSVESSPGGTKFTKDEWAGTFKPQTFMPPPASRDATPISQRAPRRARVPSIKPTMGTAAVVEDGDTSDDKPLFKGRNPTMNDMPTAPSPDPMDVDTPAPSTSPVPSATEEPNANARGPPKTFSGPGQPPADTEYLKVNFEDLKIQDLMSSLELPTPPTAPQIPSALMPPTPDTLDAYLEKFRAYMRDWDLFSSRMMLHLVARKNQNDALGATRWLNPDGISFYRKGLQEDSAVLKWWSDAMEKHGVNMKLCQVLKTSNHAKSTRSSTGQAAGGR